ncbi:MAG: hypothetical protein L6Q60_07190 [Rhodocyclaceae bacterium]|nr:hypothetical protein [Rhodocyclaceae bacterium]
MKSTPIVAAVLAAGFLMINPVAAEGDKAASNDAKVEKQPKHSHVQEKTGVPQSMPEKKSDKPNPAKDMSKHYHPRDNK